jgi:hypothetical protein
VGLAVVCVLAAGACSDGDGEPDANATTTTGARRPLAARLCDAARPVRAGTVADPEVVELSGLAASRREPGLFWVHNDSGDRARVFVIGSDGAAGAQVALAGADAVDWEDIAVADGEAGDDIYVADIGDNAARRATIDVYSFTADPSSPGTEVDAARLRLQYPDGAHDAEALMVDPRTGDLVIVTKGYDGRAGVYTLPAASAAPRAEPQPLTKAATLSLGALQAVTAGDISPAGDVIVLRTYTSVFVFARAGDEPVAAALGREPCEAPAPLERQGEAIAVDADGEGYTTISEGSEPTIWHVAAAPDGR